MEPGARGAPLPGREHRYVSAGRIGRQCGPAIEPAFQPVVLDSIPISAVTLAELHPRAANPSEQRPSVREPAASAFGLTAPLHSPWKSLTGEVHGIRSGIGHPDAGWTGVFIEPAMNLETGSRRRCGDQTDDDLADERLAAPDAGDEREQRRLFRGQPACRWLPMTGAAETAS